MIPGLSVEGHQSKPLRLNLDLSSIILPAIKPRPSGDSKNSNPIRPVIAGGDQPRPQPWSRTAASDIGDDIFLSDDDLEEEEEKEREMKMLNNNNNTMQCSKLSEENVALRRENERLKEKMLAERQLNEEYHNELRRENQILEANLELLELMKSRDMESSLQTLKSDLEEKEDELKKNTETIQELNKLVQQERNSSSVLRGLLVEEMINRSAVKSDGKQVSGKQYSCGSTIREISALKYLLPAGIFVSEAELQKVAGKLRVFDEISARLKSSQSRSEEKIVQLEQNLETVQLENSHFRNQINNLRKMLAFFDLM